MRCTVSIFIIAIFFTITLLVSLCAKEAVLENEISVNNSEILALEKVEKFISLMRGDKPVLYSDEVEFFGDCGSYASMYLLIKLGYMNENTGEKTNIEPKYSPLCELIRLKKFFITTNKPINQSISIADGDYTYGNNQILKDARFFNYNFNIVYLQDGNDRGQLMSADNLLVLFNYTKEFNQIIYSFMVNGKDVNELIGFSINDDGHLVLSNEIIEYLREHLNKLDAQ